MNVVEGYGYKIIFADGSWYWGTSQYKGAPPEKDGYYGSPKTHKAKWNEPHSKIVLKVFYDEGARLDYEDICITPDLDNPKCLNEHNGRGFSREVCRRGARVSAEKSRGVPRTKEVKEKIASKHRGKRLSPEHIQKLKDAERPSITPEAIAKSVENRKGYRHSEDTKKKIGNSNTGKTRSEELRRQIAESVRGFKWYNNGSESIQARSHPGAGWVKGRLLGWASPRTQGMKWYHKDGKRKMFKEDPGDGWVLGRLDIPHDNNPTNKGKSWYNDGKANKMFVEPPEGWTPGMIRRKNG